MGKKLWYDMPSKRTTMKKIVYWLMLAAVLSVPNAPVVQNAAAEEEGQEETAETQNSPESLRSRLAELDQSVAELKDPAKSFVAKYERTKKDVETRIRNVEENQRKLAELQDKLKAVTEQSYTFTVVPPDKRYEYEDEGNRMVKHVAELLAGKEPEQIEGLILFEGVHAQYQGITEYPAALAQCRKVVDRLEKKWTAAKERLTKERQGYSASTRTKVEENEQNVFKKQAQKMEKDGKDIAKDWFVPTSGAMKNIPLLDALLQRVRATKRTVSQEPAEDAGKVTPLLHEFWGSMEAVVSTMQRGETEAAMEMLNDSKAYQDITSVSRYSMPDQYKQDIRKQHQELRNDMRKRMNEERNIQRDIQREQTSMEREINFASSRLEQMAEDVEREKNEIARKAEEEAERKAEEEARRAEEDDAAADGGAEGADADKPAKKKKKRKKTAEKKETTAEE